MLAPNAYSSIRINLHWLIVALILLQFMLKGGMVATMEAVRLGATPDVLSYLLGMLHLLNGIAIGCIMMWRLILRLKAPQQETRTQSAHWQEWLAAGVHRMFYATLLFLPVTGLLAYYDVAVAATWHRYGQWLLLLLVCLHLLGVVYHHFWLRDQCLQRMLRRSDSAN